ncbi:hypothetical protein CVT25_001415 [Psilocybe cyanescens]|uniref:Uncharacterized protein n=1 Tax=Psilocybe cyanescens TaxID=93625 RepID=A0A409WNC7_PSICY|nr:hypothetical protein CVT25_001415 [Psilocybe cyanescens]
MHTKPDTQDFKDFFNDNTKFEGLPGLRTPEITDSDSKSDSKDSDNNLAEEEEIFGSLNHQFDKGTTAAMKERKKEEGLPFKTPPQLLL